MSNTDPGPRDQEREPRTTFQPTPGTSTLTSTITANNQRQETQIDPLIKTYIDESIRASTTTIITSIKQYIDTQFEKQRLWNEQLQTNINDTLSQVTQANPNISNSTQDNSSTPVDHSKVSQKLQRSIDPSNIAPANNLASTSKGKEAVNSSGKYPPTPVLNDLIMKALRVTIQDQNTATTIAPMSLHLFKPTRHKYPSFDYSKFKGIYDIQGFTNPHAAKTEIKLWKAIAFGLYTNLQEFSYTNLLDNIKEAEDEPTLQSTEGGTISIKRQLQHTVFNNISEWLLAFKAYMDTVLVIYENREQELNTYQDNINELCLKQSFHAVMSYDEDQRVTLVTNRDSTLLDCDLEAEGRNFDLTTVKKHRNSIRRATRPDIEWPDGREICINWNKHYCADENNCRRVHACLICKKSNH
ncbi:20067_t:CDS:2, partial [Cetraspora pellucida]